MVAAATPAKAICHQQRRSLRQLLRRRNGADDGGMTANDTAALRPEQLAANLARFRRVAAVRPELKQASVAVCIMGDGAGDSLLITRRAPTLRAHAGQWALPGGRLDAAETIESGALRELAEETGLRVEPDAVLGLLDDYVTRSGYVMTPVVVWGGVAAHELKGSASEVARVYRVPLADLDVEPEFLAVPESTAPVIRLPLFDRYVHAPTAAIIYQFCQVALHGREQRVAHFEAPAFLWR
jgi:8-oxo-dGTP pyrophosphatase MutT (NUDIX family)